MKTFKIVETTLEETKDNHYRTHYKTKQTGLTFQQAKKIRNTNRKALEIVQEQKAWL